MTSGLHISVWQKQISCEIESNKLHLLSMPIKTTQPSCLEGSSSSWFTSHKTNVESQGVGSGVPQPDQAGVSVRAGKGTPTP